MQIFAFSFLGLSFGGWHLVENQCRYFAWLEHKLGVQTYQDWHHIRINDIHKFGGRGLLDFHHQRSLNHALETVYPEYEWHSWDFTKITDNYWAKQINQRDYFNWVREKYAIQSSIDWYQTAYPSFPLKFR